MHIDIDLASKKYKYSTICLFVVFSSNVVLASYWKAHGSTLSPLGFEASCEKNAGLVWDTSHGKI